MTKYYSKSKQKFIEIANMPDQYVRNAFVKMCKHEPTEDTTYQPYDNQGRVRDYQVEFTKVAKERDDYKKKANDMEMAKMNINRELLDAKDKLKDTVTREIYNVMWDNCQKLEEEVRLLRGSREMAYDRIKSFIPKGDLKMFSEIPNTDEGWEFVDKLKHYLNKESYKIRVRGQYLDDETKKNIGWRRYTYGQPIEKSRCLRVYVDIKKDVD